MAQKIPNQSLGDPLPRRPGPLKIDAEWLINCPKGNAYDKLPIEWLGDGALLYVAPAAQAVQSIFEMMNAEGEVAAWDLRAAARKPLARAARAKAAPDATGIAMTKMREGKKQLALAGADGSGLREVPKFAGGVSGFPKLNYDYAWSPSSRELAFHHQELVLPWEVEGEGAGQPGDGKEVAEVSSAVLADAPQPKMKGASSSIDIIDVSTLESKTIYTFEGNIRNLSWFPDGSSVLFMADRPEDMYNSIGKDQTFVKRVYLDGREETLVSFRELQQLLCPLASPDGSQVLIMWEADNPLFNFMPSLGLIASTGDSTNKIKRITYDVKLEQPLWSKNGKEVFVIRSYGPYKNIYAVDIESGNLRQVTKVSQSISSYSLSPNGEYLAWSGEDVHENWFIMKSNTNGEETQVVTTFCKVPQDISLSEVREIEWEPSNYPSKLRGLLLYPLNYEEGKSYPLIVDIHGGGPGNSMMFSGGLILTTQLEWQMWTAMDYAVFVPDFRSSCSFGSLAISRDMLKEHNLLDCDVSDIASGVQKIVSLGIADPKRVIALGHSSGGKIVNWLIVSKYQHQFCAAISKEGWADDWYLMGAKPLQRMIDMYGGPPSLVPENYRMNSALYHAHNARTPTLFIMGHPKNGGIDSYESVRFLYNALKENKVETQYVQYPDEGHTIDKHVNQRDMFKRVITWINKFTSI